LVLREEETNFSIKPLSKISKTPSNILISAMNLQTKRLHLRPIESTDLNAIHHLHSLPESDEFNALGIPKDLDETQAIIQPWIEEHQAKSPKNLTFVIELKNAAAFIGLIAIKLRKAKYRSAEVWYKLLPDHWRKGYATEALRCILQLGFDELNLHRIEAGCAVANIGSIKVLEKVGMTREGRKRQVLPPKSGWSDNFEYAILEDERG